MTVDAATNAIPLGSKPKKWAHGGEVGTYTLANGQIVEIVAAVQLVWSATAADYVLSTIPTLRTAGFTISSSGATVVAAVPLKRIKVYSIVFSVDTDGTTVQFLDSASALGGGASYAQYGGYSRTVDPPNFLMATAAGNALKMTVAGGTASGEVAYWTDDAT